MRSWPSFITAPSPRSFVQLMIESFQTIRQEKHDFQTTSLFHLELIGAPKEQSVFLNSQPQRGQNCSRCVRRMSRRIFSRSLSSGISWCVSLSIPFTSFRRGTAPILRAGARVCQTFNPHHSDSCNYLFFSLWYNIYTL